MPDDVTWMSYAELAAALGISGDSARNLVRRKRWQRRAGNDGLARIGVPDEHLARHPPTSPPLDLPSEGASEPPPSPPSDLPIVSEALAVLVQHTQRLETELREVKAELEGERARVIELTAEAAISGALRETVNALKGAIAADKAQLIEVRADRDRWQAQATAPRGFLGWLRRTG